MMFQEMQLMARIAVSIVLEASPFLLLGSLLSAVIDRYVDQGRIAQRIPEHPIGRIAAGLVGGLILPICECGSVPVARRLLAKGVPSQTAIVYMLAAPVINPLVLLSTYVAFGGNMQMVLSRILLVAISASLLGWILGDRNSLKKCADLHDARTPTHSFSAHQHHHGNQMVANNARTRFGALDLLSSSASEFLDMGKYLILGAMAAAAVKVFLPWQLVQTFASNVAISVGLLMVLAVLLSICSEADAFVAASFVFFPPAAQLAFITIGPMVDLKLMGMYFFAFRRTSALILIVIPIIWVFVSANLVAFLMR